MDLAHHVPPPLRPDATWEEDEAGELLDRYRPDYWLSGHIHNLPYVSGNTWRAQFGKTMVLIPGQVMTAQFPNHITLDLYSGKPLGRRPAERKKNEIRSRRLADQLGGSNGSHQT